MPYQAFDVGFVKESVRRRLFFFTAYLKIFYSIATPNIFVAQFRAL